MLANYRANEIVDRGLMSEELNREFSVWQNGTGELLRRSEARYRALIEATGQCVWSWSFDGTPSDVDLLIRWWEDLTGQSFSDHATNQAAWLNVIHPDDRERIADLWKSANDTVSSYAAEYRVRGKAGDWRHIRVRAAPIRFEDGSIREWVGTNEDRTDEVLAAAERARQLADSDLVRRQTEEELRDIRSRMEAALAAGAIGTWSWDIQSNQFYGDASCARIFAVDQNSVNGGKIERLFEAIHPDDRRRVQSLLNEVLENPTSTRYLANYRITQSDGTWKWVTARGQVEKDAEGRPVRFPGVVVDVTEWKQAEEKLLLVTTESEQQRRLYETILSNTPDFVYVFSLDHRVVYANQSLLEMWGWSSDEVQGKTFLELGYEPWHAEMHCREIDEVRKTKKSIRGVVPFHGTNGHRIYEYIFVPVMGTEGDVIAVAGTTRDVTQSRKLEDALRESDRRKDEFLAMLAHELRNPLVPIRSGLDILSLDPTIDKSILGIMQDQMVHIIRLVDDLLDISRIMQGKVELRKETIEAAEVCRRSIAACRPIIDANNQTVDLELPDDPLWLNVDPVRIVQVIGNLLNNAAKYMHSGGRIQMSVSRDGDFVVIQVKDEGIGIEADLLPRVFELFTQSSRSLDRAQGGLGIGLTLVQHLVQLHEGTVSAHSDGIGHGSVFTVKLVAVAPPSSSKSIVAEPRNECTRSVVVVDDNRMASLLISKLITMIGDHRVSVAHDGESALSLIDKIRPEIVLLDIGLPGMDGYTVCRTIRSRPELKDVFLVALTGYGQDKDRQQSKEAGFDMHVVKPPSIDEIRKVLQHPSLPSESDGNR